MFRIRQFFVMIEELGSIISRAAVKDAVRDEKYYLGFDEPKCEGCHLR